MSTQSEPSAIIEKILIAVIGIVYLGSGLLPVLQLWGFNHLHYLNGFIALLFATLFIIAIFLPFKSIVPRQLIILTRKINTLPKFYRAVIWISFTATILYVFRVHVHYLGDGYQRIHQIEAGFSYLFTEPLDFFLHAVLYKVLNLIANVNGETTYVLFSMICGAIFVYIVVSLKWPKNYSNLSEAVAKTIILTMGGSLLFFGYVESYSLCYLFLVLYLLFAARYYSSGAGFISASLCFSIAILAHVSMLALLPSFLYLQYSILKSPGAMPLPRRLIPLFMLVVTLAIHFVFIIFNESQVEANPNSILNALLPLYSRYWI